MKLKGGVLLFLCKPVFFVVSVLLIFGVFFSTFVFVPALRKAEAYPAYAPSSDFVQVAPYDSATDKWGPGWGMDVAGTKDFVTIGQQYRVRQNGTISRVRFYYAAAGNATAFYIKIWRKNGTNYDLVGTSNNLIGSLDAVNYNTVDLSTPITGVQEGDYYGYRVETGGTYNFRARTGITGVTSYYVTNATPSSTNYNWAAQSASTGFVLPIELYMQTPQAAFIGDSIIAGHPDHYSFLETTATTNITSTIENQFSNLTGYAYQNMGIGSQTTTSISARFANDIIALKPRVVVIEGSVNDIAASVPKATFLANWTSMLDAAQAETAIARIIVLKILPWTNGTNSQMQTRDDWNNSLASLAANYSRAIVVDASSYVGQFRAGGDPGNLWDIKPAYSVDGVHFNQAGHGQIAQALADLGLPDDSTPPTITSITSSFSGGTYNVGQSIPIIVNFSELVDSTGNVTITLNTTPVRTCLFTLAGTNYGSCSYTVQTNDSSSPLDVASISGIIRDLAGNNLINYSPAQNLLASKNIVIDGSATPPILVPNSDIVEVGPYDSAVNGPANWGYNNASGYRELFTLGQQYRIRQNGTISRIRLYVADKTNMTGFYLKIWRRNGSNYDLIGTSENLINSLTNASYSTIDLVSPITGVQEGDYHSYRVEKSVGGYSFFARTGVAGVATYFVNDVTPSTTNYNWTSKSYLAGAVLPIELYMQAPQVVFIGDGIIAGHPNHYSFVETNTATNIASTIENQFNGLTIYSYQNMGVGSQTTTDISARFTNDAISLKPKLIVAEGGVQDIVNGVPKSTFLSNWTSILDAAQAESTLQGIIVIKILPWTNGTNSQMQTRDDWNNSLASLAANYSRAIVVDASSYVGQFRAGGDPGNLWDIKTEYNSDGVNFNQIGYGQIAQAIYDSYQPVAPSGFTGTVVSSTQINWLWTNNSSTADNLQVLDGLGNAVSSLLSGTSTSWSEISLAPHTSYTRKVRATTSIGGGSDSNTDTKTTLTSSSGHREVPSPAFLSPTAVPTATEIIQTVRYYLNMPFASFSISSPRTFDSPFAFDASESFSTKGILKYEWDFGDGTKAEGIKVDHQYQSPGRYTVKLTVTDRASNTATKEQTIEVKPNAPTITNITARGTALWIEGKSDPDTIIYFTIHSTTFEGKGSAEKNGYWTYSLENASEVLGEGDHTIFALAAVKLSDNTELRGAESKTYDFKMSVDNGKLKVEMKKTRIWQFVSAVSGLVIILLAIFWVLKRKRAQKNY